MIVQRFLHWLETAPNSSRADAAAALARASLSLQLSDQEQEAAEAALTLLLDDPSAKVRLAMADVLASHIATPRHLIMALAQDQSDIAMQVLCRSPLFLDQELIDIAANNDAVALIAIACRQPISNNVASAVIAEGNFDACLALLQNTTSKLTAKNLRIIAEKTGKRADIREALLKQPCLPAEIRQSLIAGLSSALQELVIDNSWLEEARAKKVVREARDRATDQLAMDIPLEEIPPLIEHLRATGQLTTAFLIRVVCSGNITMFTAAIANLSDIPESRILAVLQQGRTAAFRAIYDRSNLPDTAIPVFTAAVDIWHEQADTLIGMDDLQLRRHVVERIITQYTASTSFIDEALLALLRRISTEVTRDAALLRAREISTAA